MKQPINEIKKMQRIAGLITESEYQEEITKDEKKVNEVYGFENDDLIYDNMVTMDIDQLVSDMLSTVEKEPSSTLKDYVLKYDSSEDDNDDYDTDYEEPNEPFDIAEAKGKTEDETWFSDVKYFKKEHEGYKLKPTDMVSIGDIPAMTYANAIKKFGLKEEFSDINEALEPHVYERMYNLSNIKAQQAMIRAAEIMMNDLTAEGFEVEEIREFFTQLIANDI